MDGTTTDAERLAREYGSIWNERDYDRIPDLVAESATIEDPILPDGNVRGHDGLEDWIRETVSQYPDFKGEVVDLLSGDDTVMALIEYSMTPNSEFEEGSPTNPAVTFEGMVRLRFEDGKLQEHRGFYDPQTLYDELNGSE